MKSSRKPGMGKFYLLLGGIAVVAVVAMLMGGNKAKQDAFVVDPSVAVSDVKGFSIGDPNAPVKVSEFADFECPACMVFATVTEPDVRKRLVETGQVQFTFYFFPLEQHRNAAGAAYAAACAADQNKFWEMHDKIFFGFNDWEANVTRNPQGVFSRYAADIGLDVAAWKTCYESDKHHALITSHKAEGMRRGVTSTPTFFIGNRMVPGAVNYDQFKGYVDQALAAQPAVARPDSTAAPAGTR
ncbi:MAG TPA: thioredoxin domain-containing protein [Gemmatimonadaceae bacterium]|nr:thioredoxin domain-containing protein [Gemmatimonadaceae bacterium]